MYHTVLIARSACVGVFVVKSNHPIGHYVVFGLKHGTKTARTRSVCRRPLAGRVHITRGCPMTVALIYKNYRAAKMGLMRALS